MFTSRSFLAIALLVPFAAALPARDGSVLDARRESSSTEQQYATRSIAVSGSLIGPTSLVGYDADLPKETQDTYIPTSAIDFAPGQASDTIGAILDFKSVPTPQPIRGTHGGTDPGPRQIELDQTHPDVFAPPSTDSGTVAQLNWPMDLSHVKYGKNNAGWSRQQNTDQLPKATDFAGVDMRLEPGAYRELHWHSANEWSLVLNGSARVEAVNEKGETFIDDVNAGDVWFFPSGIPHYIQALDDGVEFLLVFDDGEFSEDSTFLVTEMFFGNPKEVWSKDLDLPVDAFKDLPQSNLFIFNGTEAPADISKQNVTGAAGPIPKEVTYSYHWSQQEPLQAPGGSVKVLDTNTFPIAADFSTALVTIKPGAMREVHWHPSSDEWSFFISGEARMTVYAAQGNSRTFDYRPGDVGYVPTSYSHYVENLGTEDVVFLEVLKQAKFTDVSVGQWLALLPHQVVQDHLHLSDESLAHLSKDEAYVVQGKVPTESQ